MPRNPGDAQHASGATDDDGNTAWPSTGRQNGEALFDVTDEDIELLDGTQYGELSFESYVNQVR